jgi:hypothetical protein
VGCLDLLRREGHLEGLEVSQGGLDSVEGAFGHFVPGDAKETLQERPDWVGELANTWER